MGTLCQAPFTFLHSLPFPAATAAAATAFLHFTLPRQAIARSPLRVGSRFALHTTPRLCWCLTVCFHTPLWGLGADGTFRYSRTFQGGSVWFVVVTHTNFPILWSRHQRAPQLPKSPRQAPLAREPLAPADSATTTSTFQTLQLLWRAVHLSCDSRWVVGRFSG